MTESSLVVYREMPRQFCVARHGRFQATPRVAAYHPSSTNPTFVGFITSPGGVGFLRNSLDSRTRTAGISRRHLRFKRLHEQDFPGRNSLPSLLRSCSRRDLG